MASRKPVRAGRVRGSGLIEVSFRSARSLAAAFMPQVAGGGLFVATQESYALGDIVCLVVRLHNETRIPVMGRVMWITPPDSVSHRRPGIGVQLELDDNAQRLVGDMTHLLSASEMSRLRTHTF